MVMGRNMHQLAIVYYSCFILLSFICPTCCIIVIYHPLPLIKLTVNALLRYVVVTVNHPVSYQP